MVEQIPLLLPFQMRHKAILPVPRLLHPVRPTFHPARAARFFRSQFRQKQQATSTLRPPVPTKAIALLRTHLARPRSMRFSNSRQATIFGVKQAPIAFPIRSRATYRAHPARVCISARTPANPAHLISAPEALISTEFRTGRFIAPRTTISIADLVMVALVVVEIFLPPIFNFIKTTCIRP